MRETRFKETEIGLIPEDWEEKRLGEIGKIIGGGTPSTFVPEFWNGNIQWFTPAEISSIGKYASKSERTITNSGLISSSAKLLPKGSILLTTRASIGLCSILLNEASTNQGFQSIVVSSDNNNEFVYYVLLTAQREMVALASGSTFLEISPKKLSSIKLAMPTKPEQQAIAEALSDVDGLLREMDAMIAKKRAMKDGMMQELLSLTPGPSPEGEGRSPRRRLDGFCGEWEEKTIKQLCEVKRGVRVTREMLSKEGGYPVFQNTNYPLGYFHKFNVEANTPFVIVGGSAGLVGMCNKNYWAADDCVYFSKSNYLNHEFLYCVLTLRQSEIKNHVRNASVPRLDRKVIENLVVPVPTVNEQEAIARVLSDMDAEIEALEAKRAKYEQVKQGMMQELLSGRIRLV